MILLSLSDFHVTEKTCKELEILVSSFCKYLDNFFLKKPDWKPDFICVNGDIAGKGLIDEFDLAGKYIRQIARQCELNDDYVLFAPGNHDMSFPVKLGEKRKDETSGKYIFECSESYNNFVLKYFSEIEEFCDDMRKEPGLACEVFDNYSSFRSSFLHEKNYSTCLKNDSLKYTTGFREFKNYQVVFLELNNTWVSFPYKDEYTYQLCFGSNLIENYMNELENYKSKGYFIVALFHHPFRYLDHKEFQSSGNSYCPYDAIIKMADICLSGHEHGPESKRIDCLGNMSQYLLNGGFFAPAGNSTDSSAVLIKIDKENEHILTCQICCKKRTSPEWRAEGVEKYRLASAFYHKYEQGIILTEDLQYKRIYCKKEIEERLLREKIAEAYFGKNYKLEEDGNGIYSLQEIKHSTNPGKICFIDIDRFDESEKIGLQSVLNEETINRNNEKNPLLVICYRPHGDYFNLDEKYAKLKTIYNKEILQGKLVFLCAVVEKN